MNGGVVRAGLQSPPQTPRETQDSEVDDAQYDAPAVESVADDRLQMIIDEWVRLSESTKNAIIQLMTRNS